MIFGVRCSASERQKYLDNVRPHAGGRSPRDGAKLGSMGLFDEVKSELASFLNDAAGAHAFALMGLHLAHEQMTRVAAESINPTAPMLMGVGDPSEAGTVAYQSWSLNTIPDRLTDDGQVAIQLGQQWIVTVYAHWEHYFRSRFAEALGCSRDDVRVPLMGDMRHLRHDVLHHRGVATEEHTGRCEVLKDWFAAGEMILIDTKKVAQFMRHVGLTFTP
jgi:hypothetical protein